MNIEKATIALQEQDEYINEVLFQIAEYITSVPISKLKADKIEWVNSLTPR